MGDLSKNNIIIQRKRKRILYKSMVYSTDGEKNITAKITRMSTDDNNQFEKDQYSEDWKKIWENGANQGIIVNCS